MFFPEAADCEEIYKQLQTAMEAVNLQAQFLGGPPGEGEPPGEGGPPGVEAAEEHVFDQRGLDEVEDGPPLVTLEGGGMHLANDPVWSVSEGSVNDGAGSAHDGAGSPHLGAGSAHDGAGSAQAPGNDLLTFGHMTPPRGGWMVPLLVAIKMMHNQRVWSIAQRLSNHVAIRDYVKDHHLTMIHRGNDSRYYTH